MGNEFEIEKLRQKRQKILLELHELIKQGKLTEFDDLFFENNPKYESAMELFCASKEREWIDIIANNNSEQAKKDFIKSLPESVYFEVMNSLSSITSLRDAGMAKRSFEESYGKSVHEVLNELEKSWEKYNEYELIEITEVEKDSQENPLIDPKEAVKNALANGITLENVSDVIQQQTREERSEEEHGEQI